MIFLIKFSVPFIPTGFNHSAQCCRAAATLGTQSNIPINPKRVESIPHIPFIEFDFITLQQLSEFVLKRNLPMMFFLPGDVISHVFDLREADGENAIAVLPCEIREVGRFGFQPQRRTAFDLLDHVRRVAGARQRAEQMNVVFHTANDDGLAFEIREDAAEIAMQFVAQWFVADLHQHNGLVLRIKKMHL